MCQLPWPDGSIQCMDNTARVVSSGAPPPPVDISDSRGSQTGIYTRIGRGVGATIAMPTIIDRSVEWLMAFLHMAAALQMVQALTLMAIYTMLPLIVVMSGYRLEMMWYGAIGIFTVKFWTVLWFIAQWIDDHLWDAMYNGVAGTMLWGDITQSLAGNGPMTPKRLVLDITLMGMNVGLPMIWSGMMTWIGIHVGTVLSQYVSKNAQPGKETGTGMKAPSPGDAIEVAKKVATVIAMAA